MNEEELMLNGLLIDKCKEEGIMIALVAINRETKEIELPQSFKAVSYTHLASDWNK